MPRTTPVLFATIATGILVTAGCRGERIICHWTDQPVVVDAQSGEWTGMSGGFIDDVNLAVTMCNDAKNLYVLLKFRDTRWLRAGLRHGLTVWFDAAGRKHKQFGLRLTGGGSMPRPHFQGNPPEPSSEAAGDQMLEAALASQQTLLVNGPTDSGTLIDPNRVKYPNARFGVENLIYICEMAVPLQASDSTGSVLGTKPGAEISVGFEMKNPAPERPNQRMQPDRDRGGIGMPGGGGPGGGGRPGGRPPGDVGGRGRGYAPKLSNLEVWLQTRLAKPPVEGNSR